ncbi:hypothetical protein OPS25_15010 [Alteromonas ponticola]|uniref:GAF domain-containing protein n=1 Tax=Alteromonas aquimaris TaxID=2998417 RepID=A0ABT3PB72_9ALTE|nr:hypothetical protein [Alteromonas aquimaris]MCW8109815.1 hypothetical protein [Alteromonas aquimaris]
MEYVSAFHNIAYDQSLTFDNKVASLLQLGKNLFNVDTGMVAHVEASGLTVAVLETDLSRQKINKIRPPLLAFSEEVLEKAQSTSGRHSDNKSTSLFVGAPILCHSAAIGVIVYASSRRTRPFSHRHLNYLELFSRWYSYEFVNQYKHEEYKQNIEMLNRFESIAKVGTWEVNLRTKQMKWSDQTKLIHQVPLDYVPNLETAIDFYKEGYSRDAISNSVENAITSGESWQLELELVTAKNRAIWVKANGIAEFVENECIRLFGTFHDISHEMIIREDLKADVQDSKQRIS